jgi:hypothetical protein
LCCTFRAAHAAKQHGAQAQESQGKEQDESQVSTADRTYAKGRHAPEKGGKSRRHGDGALRMPSVAFRAPHPSWARFYARAVQVMCSISQERMHFIAVLQARLLVYRSNYSQY